MRSTATLLFAFLAIAAGCAPAAAQVKTFRNWLAACDNVRSCAAYRLDESAAGPYLRFERGAAGDAEAKLSIVIEGKPGAVRLAFNDPAIVGLPAGPLDGKYNSEIDKTEIAIPATPALIDALRKATELNVTAGDGGASSISLSGAVAALLWIDEQQKRLDTVTALIRRGNKPASAVPPPPALPVVRAATPGATPQDKTFPKAVLAKGRTACGSDDPNPEAGEVNALSGDLVAYWFECRAMSGAYNSWSALIVAPRDRPDAARLVQLPYPRGEVANEGIEKHLIVNVGFDEKALKLSMFSKSRGPGDCGSAGEWVFDGKEFRLTRYQAMPVCAGLVAEEWPVIFRAEVK